jgi:hypothetical protein
MRCRAVIWLAFSALFASTEGAEGVQISPSGDVSPRPPSPTVAKKIQEATTAANAKAEHQELLAALKDLVTKFTAIEHKVTAIEHKVTAIEHNLKELPETIVKEVAAIEHDKHHNRARLLLSACKMETCKHVDGRKMVEQTVQSIFLRGQYFRLTVKHGQCHKDIGQIECKDENLDVMFWPPGCPASGSALNVSATYALRIGDEASAAGFISQNHKYIERFWAGRVAGKNDDLTQLELSDVQVKFRADEYVFVGAQLKGMSGAPVANGLGYTGMAHGITFPTTGLQFAMVIPFEAIDECIRDMSHGDLGKFPRHCPGIPVANI